MMGSAAKASAKDRTGAERLTGGGETARGGEAASTGDWKSARRAALRGAGGGEGEGEREEAGEESESLSARAAQRDFLAPPAARTLDPFWGVRYLEENIFVVVGKSFASVSSIVYCSRRHGSDGRAPSAVNFFRLAEGGLHWRKGVSQPFWQR